MKRKIMKLLPLIAVCYVLVFGFALSLNGQSQHENDLTWTYVQQSGADVATAFNVYRSTTTGAGYTKIASNLPITQLNYADKTGAGGTKYFYVVTAVDALGFESTFSNEVSATFLSNPNPPTALQVVAK